MLPVKNVELTKVHYYEPSRHHRNVEVPTISQEVEQNNFNQNLIIKSNIFGHKWVLKINELDGKNFKKSRSVRCIVYCIVFSCILFAVLSGIFFTFELDKKLFDCPFGSNKNVTKIARSTDEFLNENVEVNGKNGQANSKFSKLNVGRENGSFTGNETISNNSSVHQNATRRMYCANCTENHVCLKTEETAKPNCAERVDRHDPTGCGGLCIVNVEFCAILDRQHMVYQCRPLRNLLRCPSGTFNCGEQCIARNKVCDGIVHCKDMQDERFCECKMEDHFQCTNSTKCLPKAKRCDGVADCWDRSDENGCYKTCPPGQYACRDGQCIPQDNFCDGVPNCSDSSDEPQGC